MTSHLEDTTSEKIVALNDANVAFLEVMLETQAIIMERLGIPDEDAILMCAQLLGANMALAEYSAIAAGLEHRSVEETGEIVSVNIPVGHDLALQQLLGMAFGRFH